MISADTINTDHAVGTVLLSGAGAGEGAVGQPVTEARVLVLVDELPSSWRSRELRRRLRWSPRWRVFDELPSRGGRVLCRRLPWSSRWRVFDELSSSGGRVLRRRLRWSLLGGLVEIIWTVWTRSVVNRRVVSVGRVSNGRAVSVSCCRVE